MLDAHQHFWDLKQPFQYDWLKAPALEKIHRSFGPDDLKPLLDEVGVPRSVFVQTQHNVEENRWALKLAERNPWVVGVVGWVDLASPACEDQLLEFTEHPRFVGVRHITQDEPDDDFMVRPDVLRGLAVLEKHDVPFDLLFYERHLKHAVTLGRKFPGLRMVVDHLAKPRIREGILAGWIDDLTAAASCPNIYCKLSGMITEADWGGWTADDLKPYVSAAVELFSPQRCMFGSDWPVCLLAGGYGQVLDALNSALGPIDDEARSWIFGRTGEAFYRLPAEGG